MMKFITEDITETDLISNTYTFKKDVDAVTVINDGNNNLTLTINSKNYILKPGESRLYPLPLFKQVTFSVGAVFRMTGIKRGE